MTGPKCRDGPWPCLRSLSLKGPSLKFCFTETRTPTPGEGPSKVCAPARLPSLPLSVPLLPHEMYCTKDQLHRKWRTEILPGIPNFEKTSSPRAYQSMWEADPHQRTEIKEGALADDAAPMAAFVPAGCSRWKMLEAALAPGGRDTTSPAVAPEAGRRCRAC